MRKAKSNLNRTHILIAVMIIAINCAAIAGVLSAKYIKDYFPVGELKLSVKLDEKVSIIEHDAVRQDDGSYTLGATEVGSNNYEVMPGVDIKKDPQIVLEDKTAVPAYIYVEIVTDKPETVTYDLTANWLRLGTLTGLEGGPVYVYSSNGTTAEVVDSEDFPNRTNIEIIKDNILHVSDTAGPGTAFAMDIHGYVAQVVKDSSDNIKDAETTFNEVFMTPTP